MQNRWRVFFSQDSNTLWFMLLKVVAGRRVNGGQEARQEATAVVNGRMMAYGVEW